MPFAYVVLKSLVPRHGVSIQARSQNRNRVALAGDSGLVSDGVDPEG